MEVSGYGGVVTLLRCDARRRTVALAVAAAAVAAVAGCTPAVPVVAGKAAADPACASIVLALPSDLDGLARRTTSAQATAAWGGSADPVVLRCGVTPPGPTTDQCVTVTGTDGVSVDWVVTEVPETGAGSESDSSSEVASASPSPGTSAWVFTTYGRSPAVEVTVPASVAATRSTSFIDLLGPAMTAVEATRNCA